MIEPTSTCPTESEIAHRKVEERQAQEKIDIQKHNASEFGPKAADLMAALAERGVSLPAGFRSKQQQAAMFKALIDRNPGKSTDEIADDIKSGKLKLTAETAAESVRKTGRVIVAHEDSRSWGYGGEIAARISDELFEYLDAPVRRIGALDTFVGYHPVLEDAILPQVSTLATAVRQLARY